MKKKVWLFGTGRRLSYTLDFLKMKNIEILGLLDNDVKKHGTKYEDWVIQPVLNILKCDYDYVIITAINFTGMLDQLIKIGVKQENIIVFAELDSDTVYEYEEVINVSKWVHKDIGSFYGHITVVKNLIGNLPYEIADKLQKQEIILPKVKSAYDAMSLIIEQRKSLVRFGDGEFEIISGKERANFQVTEKSLGIRLLEVLVNENENIVTCIADNYGSLDKYTEQAAYCIRTYLNDKIRKEHYDVLNLKKTYYDAYVSRPYIQYNDKRNAVKLFSLWKCLWKKKKIVIVEGEYTRIGSGNDLLEGAEQVERIICPAVNAWSYYGEILNCVNKRVDKNRLILIALGPAATVLAYDLAEKGYQAIDMGHLDVEYEWFLSGTESKIPLKGKYVNECKDGDSISVIYDEDYNRQIIAKIGIKEG